MIAHIVLFRPRHGLAASDAARLLDTLQRALGAIPSIRRVSVGRRVIIGRAYEQLMDRDFPFAAVLEFDSVDGLREYLEHPSHGAVGEGLFAAADEVLVYDFDMVADLRSLAEAPT